jgi:hypothetical protein
VVLRFVQIVVCGVAGCRFVKFVGMTTRQTRASRSQFNASSLPFQLLSVGRREYPGSRVFTPATIVNQDPLLDEDFPLLG